MESKKRMAVILTLILILGMIAGCRAMAPTKEEKAIERPVPPEEAIPEARPPLPPPLPARETPVPRPPVTEERKEEAIEKPTLRSPELERIAKEAVEIEEIMEERRIREGGVPREVLNKLGEAKKSLEKEEFARVLELFQEIRNLLE